MTITLWLTGLSASGKSTLALAAAELLVVRGIACKVIDGDELRRGPCADLDYSRADRRARAGEIVEFTGVSDPCEALLAPHLIVDTHLLGVAECVARIENLLNQGAP